MRASNVSWQRRFCLGGYLINIAKNLLKKSFGVRIDPTSDKSPRPTRSARYRQRHTMISFISPCELITMRSIDTSGRFVSALRNTRATLLNECIMLFNYVNRSHNDASETTTTRRGRRISASFAERVEGTLVFRMPS